MTHALLAAQARGNGHSNGGWNGQEGGGGGGAGKKLRADGSINVRTENVNGGSGGSYEGISPDSVCGAQAVPNGLASPARRAPSGMSEWGAASDGIAVNSRDQLLSHQRVTSSQHSAGSPHAQVCNLCRMLSFPIGGVIGAYETLPAPVPYLLLCTYAK